MGYNRIEETSNESDPLAMELEFNNDAVLRWANALAMFHDQNPHVTLDNAKMKYTVCEDGSLKAYIDGINLSVRIKEGEWSWK